MQPDPQYWMAMLRSALSSARGTPVLHSDVTTMVEAVLDAFDVGDLVATRREGERFLDQTAERANANVESAFQGLLCYREDPSRPEDLLALVTYLNPEKQARVGEEIRGRRRRLDLVEPLLEVDSLSRIRVLVRRLNSTL